MKTEDQIRALAELDGVGKPTPQPCECGCGRMLTKPWYVQPYLTSRDAIISVIEKWCGNDNERWNAVCYKLIDALSIDCHGRTIYALRWIAMATAEKLAESLLRATGKWVEEFERRPKTKKHKKT